ncbi:hypothetical protein F5I97DRAFT_1559039 [Phlebopus sp. FC_14]|nr:hypothetical protein F5I97DRAFT_1559039 [Phlebopus sp. FC_14]
MSTSWTSKKQFPGAWPDFDSTCHEVYTTTTSQLRDRPAMVDAMGEATPSRTSPEGSYTQARPSSPSRPVPHPSGNATSLRIIVPPSEYCPFTTDLTLPITPLSLPAPLDMSYFTSSPTREPASAPPTPGLILSSLSPDDAAVADLASPTSSQFLLMPPTPRSADLEGVESISSPRLNMPSVADGSKSRFPLGESKDAKAGNPRPWEVTSSTWLSDLGGDTETDRIFRRNLHYTAMVETQSSPISTAALNVSPLLPTSAFPSALALDLPPMSLESAPVSSPSAPSSCLMSPQPLCSSPARLALQPTGTATFPSTVDSLQAWREGVVNAMPEAGEQQPSILRSSPGRRSIALPEPQSAIQVSSPTLDHSFPLGRHTLSKPQNFINRAKKLGGRVKQFVTRRRGNRRNNGMDRDVNLRITTRQDSEDGSVILINAPPPPYNDLPLISLPLRSLEEQDLPLGRLSISEHSPRLPGSILERSTTGGQGTDTSSRQEGSSRNALRRLSLAAFSTMKRM